MFKNLFVIALTSSVLMVGCTNSLEPNTEQNQTTEVSESKLQDLAAPAHPYDAKASKSRLVTKLYKINIDRENNNCKTVEYISSWDKSQDCEKEMEVLVDKDAEAHKAKQDGVLDAETGELAQFKTRWTEDGKINWRYMCSRKQVTDLEKVLTFCK